MSVAATSAVFFTSLPANQKIVALALADHADPGGCTIRPSIKRLAMMTSMSERSVQRMLKQLLKEGIIEIEEPPSRYTPTMYRLSMQIMGDKLTPMEPSGVTTKGGHGCQIDAFMGDKAVSPERSKATETERKTTPLTPQGGTEPSSPPAWGSVEALVTLYNDRAPDNVPAVETISPKRRHLAAKWLKIYPDQRWWVEVFDAYHRSRFLSGRSKPTPGHESFRPDFDWLLANGKSGVENAVKVHDGAYDD